MWSIVPSFILEALKIGGSSGSFAANVIGLDFVPDAESLNSSFLSYEVTSYIPGAIKITWPDFALSNAFFY